MGLAVGVWLRLRLLVGGEGRTYNRHPSARDSSSAVSVLSLPQGVRNPLTTFLCKSTSRSVDRPVLTNAACVHQRLAQTVLYSVPSLSLSLIVPFLLNVSCLPQEAALGRT